MYNPPISNPINIHQVEDEQSDSTEIGRHSIDVETHPLRNIHFKDARGRLCCLSMVMRC